MRWALGSVVAGYRLERKLGQGGMGEVYLARNLETGAPYAIKTLFDLRDVELRLRFAREAEVMVRVDQHPRVLRVHALGEEGGRAYLVLEYAPGGDLGQRLEAGPVTVAQAVAWARDVAEGLAHLHRAGVVHRDLKPGNIMFDAEGRLKLGDFGLARLADAQRLTVTGQLLGTPAYMSPEQITGAEAVDGAADVYALGAVLYCCLTGEAPFEGGTVPVLLERVVNEPAPDPREARPDLPPALADLCLRCLSKQASKRPTPTELIAVLDTCLAGSGSRRSGLVRARVGIALGLIGLLGLVGLRAASAPSALPSPAQATPTETPSAAPPRVARGDPPVGRSRPSLHRAKIPFDDAIAVRCLSDDEVVVISEERLAIFPLRWEGKPPPLPASLGSGPQNRRRSGGWPWIARAAGSR